MSVMEFLVQVNEEEGNRWVLAIDPAGNQILVTNDDRELHWVPMADCKFVGTPAGQPQPVFVMQPGSPESKPALTIVRGAGLPKGPNHN